MPAAYSDFKRRKLLYGHITSGAYDGTSIKLRIDTKCRLRRL